MQNWTFVMPRKEGVRIAPCCDMSHVHCDQHKSSKLECLVSKDVPILLRNAITGFPSTNRCKFEWPVNDGVKMEYIQPFSERHTLVAICVGVRCDGRTNEMRISWWTWCSNFFKSVILKPIAPIYRIIMPIRWVANVKVENVPAVLHARRIQRHRVLEGHPSKASFSRIVRANAVRDEKQFVQTLYSDSSC